MRHLLIIFFTVMLFSSCDPPTSTTTNQPTVQNPTSDTTSNQTSSSDTSQTNTKTPDATKKDKSGGAIVGKWIHSNEDDTAQHEVYRPESFNFPPSRGREALVINKDKTFEFITIEPNDTRKKTPGKWALVDGMYQFTLDGYKTVTFTATLDDNKLKKAKS